MLFPCKAAFRKDKVTESPVIGKLMGKEQHTAPSFPSTLAGGTSAASACSLLGIRQRFGLTVPKQCKSINH